MIYSDNQKIMLDEKEKKRANRILADPLKILLLLKIIKNPGLSSRQLKEDLKLKGTKIYYYLSDFEGFHPKTKKLIYKPLVRIETEETEKPEVKPRKPLKADLKEVLEEAGVTEDALPVDIFAVDKK